MPSQRNNALRSQGTIITKQYRHHRQDLAEIGLLMTVVGALTVVRGKAIGLLVVPRLIFILLLVMEVLEDYNRYVIELEDFDPSVVAEAIVEATVLWWWCERERVE